LARLAYVWREFCGYQLDSGHRKMTRIVIAETADNAGRDLSVERSIIGPQADIVHYICDGDEDRLIDACRDADAVLTDYSPFSRNVIAHLKNCRVISVAATGYNSIDIEAAESAGIRVCAIDEYCTDEVADHVILLMLALCRRLTEYHQQVQIEKRWQFDSLSGLVRLRGLTLGIIGFGKIGQAVAQRAGSFGLKLIAFDPYGNTEVASHLKTQFCSLSELYSDADIISLNCGLTNKNEHLLDAAAFQQMAKKPFLINCARGALVDESALISALDTGQIKGAALDVLSDESPDLSASKLVGRDFYSDASIQDNRRISASNLHNFLDGTLENVRHFIV
jgi:D-3-phosphoglycerate dehydrogenase